MENTFKGPTVIWVQFSGENCLENVEGDDCEYVDLDDKLSA